MIWNNNYNGTLYTDPREELRARTLRAAEVGDAYLVIPITLSTALQLKPKECEARTVVNGDRMSKTLIEIKCTKLLDPGTTKHTGLHVNGKTVWE